MTDRLPNENYFIISGGERGSEHSWYLNGNYHRDKDDEPASILYDLNDKDKIIRKSWWQFGKFHRESGPADIFTTNSYSQHCWYINGNRHRYDGPAYIKKSIIYGKTEFWALFGQQIKQSDYKKWCEDSGISLYNLTEYDKMLIRMKWGN